MKAILKAGQERNNILKMREEGRCPVRFPSHLRHGCADYNHHRTSFPPYEFVLSLGGVVCGRHSRQPQETKATAAPSLPDLSYYNKPASDRLCLPNVGTDALGVDV